MKTKSHSKKHNHKGRSRLQLFGQWVMGASLAACSLSLHAADAPVAPESQEPQTTPAADAAAEPEEAVELTPEQVFEGGAETKNNWVELSTGALLIQGSKGQAQEQQRLSDGPFGGIEDLHYQHQAWKDTVFSLDGRAIFDLNDYRLGLNLVNEKKGFIRLRYREFRTWFNGDAGFVQQPGAPGIWLPADDSTLAVDRGEFSFQAGLTLEKLPRITFEYVHQFREGTKSSTIWSPVHLDFHNDIALGTRGIGPSLYDIDESRDIFKLDATKQIKTTKVGAGVRYEIGHIDNARQMTFWQDEPIERQVTNRERSSDSAISAHAFTETWLKNNKLFFSSGFLYANLDNNFSGSRIYGDDFDVNQVPNALNGTGYTDLDGVLHKTEYVMNLNLMAVPRPALTIVPSIRVQKQNWDSQFDALQTSGVNAAAPTSGNSDGSALDVQERLDVRYSGFTNWVVFARGEWDQGQGELDENATPGSGAMIARRTDNERLFQKYSVGARYYPFRSVTFDFGGYYKNNRYDYSHDVDSTSNGAASANRYPAYLVTQGFETIDEYVRVTLRPVDKVTVVARYEHQLSTIDTKPAGASGLSEVESSEMTSHIIGANLNWVPLSRLGLQFGANYVFSETATPASDVTRAILDSQNNYWTLNANASVVLDQKTDLNLGYFYYRSDNFQNNALEGLPLGAEASEHGVTALLTRRLRPNLRLNLRYAFFNYDDVLSGHHNDYQAHALFSSLQYRF